MAETLMHRWRFLVDDDDPRPVEWPLPPGAAYWISGYDSDGKAVVIAFLLGSDIDRYWPDAEEVGDHGVYPKAVFTDRFPRPEWFVEPTDEGASE